MEDTVGGCGRTFRTAFNQIDFLSSFFHLLSEDTFLQSHTPGKTMGIQSSLPGANPTGAKILDFWMPGEPGSQSTWESGSILIEFYSRFIVEYYLREDILAGNRGSK